MIVLCLLPSVEDEHQGNLGPDYEVDDPGRQTNSAYKCQTGAHDLFLIKLEDEALRPVLTFQ